jgi:HlyD family secretion protein
MQQLQQSQIICYIIPGNTQYFAELNIPQTSFGKVNKDQIVLLKAAAYPYQQFGILKCKLDFVGAIPSDSGYTAKALLPDGLITNYGKKLQYKEGLKASAEIITENLRLSDRILKQVKSVFTNNSF